MKSIILHSHEIKALKASGKVLIVRPCKDQSPVEYVFLDKHQTVSSGEIYTGWAKHIQSLSVLVKTKCPIGEPGEQRWVKEQIKIKYNDPSMIIHYGTYTADLEPVMSEGVRMKWFWKQKSLTNIPQWASRFTVKVERVEVRKIQSISRRDAKDAGFLPRLNGLEYFEGKSYGNAEQAFQAYWNFRYTRRGFAFDADPWAWFAWVERVKR